MLVLAIETSCDETASAVVRDGRQILSSVISSQVAIHAEYGGVVPEIASRKHLEMISPVISQALHEASLSMSDIQGVAVTRGPGLSGALLVGFSAAKAIAFARNIPYVGVHHIEGHIFAAFLEQAVAFPFLALVVSGGHTHLFLVEGFGRYHTLGRTIDDAAGEAYDKSAKIMGLAYPGGASIDAMAQNGDPSAVHLPRPLLHDGSLNFSFSGLKTAMLTQINKFPVTIPSGEANDLCASFQKAVCDVLAAKTRAALLQTGMKRLVVAGGVACNSGLRRCMKDLTDELGIELHIPAPVLCGDNAAMLAVAGNYYLEQRTVSDPGSGRYRDLGHGAGWRGIAVSAVRRPLKSLGQNFLVDQHIVDKIIRSASIQDDDCILEVGPGRGALTQHLEKQAGRMLLVEFDHALAAALTEQYAGNSRVTVVDGDILAVDLASLLESSGSRWKVVANLPYNISTQVLFRFLEVRSRLSRMVLMLQKEVADRLTSAPNCSDYGVTTVLLGLWFDMRREFIVSPGCFHPRPKVDSAVVSFVPLESPRLEVGSEEIFRRVVKGAFAMRRKTLANCLKNAELPAPDGISEILDSCSIDGQRRGETLSLDEFARLSRCFSQYA